MAGSILLLGFYFVCSMLKKQGKSLDKLPAFKFIYNNEDHGNTIHNDRIRDEGVTIYEIALSKEADFTKHENANEIIASIRSI
jgi:hypothetical protein